MRAQHHATGRCQALNAVQTRTPWRRRKTKRSAKPSAPPPYFHGRYSSVASTGSSFAYNADENNP